MLIYVRHGDDRGDDVYRHDRALNDRGRKKARKAAGKLIKKYGHPDQVFVSPYRRAQETLAAMSEGFERAVEVHVDPRVAQRLSSKQRAAPSVSPETRALVDLDEDDEGFRRRIAAHVEATRQLPSTAVVWCITHKAVLKAVTLHFRGEETKSIDFLDHVVVQH